MEFDVDGRQVIRLPNGERLKFKCCFCGQAIKSAGHDPCALVVVTAWDALEGQQREQQFFSHGTCLRDRLEHSVAEELFVLDDGPSDSN